MSQVTDYLGISQKSVQTCLPYSFMELKGGEALSSEFTHNPHHLTGYTLLFSTFCHSRKTGDCYIGNCRKMVRKTALHGLVNGDEGEI